MNALLSWSLKKKGKKKWSVYFILMEYFFYQKWKFIVWRTTSQ